MKEDFYGNEKCGFHGSIEIVPGKDFTLLNCPFCGDSNVEVWNIHSPYYTVRCLMCGAECPSDDDVHDGNLIKNLDMAKKIHLKALKSAIANWNKRV